MTVTNIEAVTKYPGGKFTPGLDFHWFILTIEHDGVSETTRYGLDPLSGAIFVGNSSEKSKLFPDRKGGILFLKSEEDTLVRSAIKAAQTC